MHLHYILLHPPRREKRLLLRTGGVFFQGPISCDAAAMDGQWLSREEFLAIWAGRGAPWTEPQLQRLVRHGVLPYSLRIGYGRRGVHGFFPVAPSNKPSWRTD